MAYTPLSNVEKRLVEKYGWVDNGDGTLSEPYQGRRYDHEAGESYSERMGLGEDYVAADFVSEPEPEPEPEPAPEPEPESESGSSTAGGPPVINPGGQSTSFNITDIYGGDATAGSSSVNNFIANRPENGLDGSTGVYTYFGNTFKIGETYNGLPANVAYSKMVQDWRMGNGFGVDSNSAWARYSAGIADGTITPPGQEPITVEVTENGLVAQERETPKTFVEFDRRVFGEDGNVIGTKDQDGNITYFQWYLDQLEDTSGNGGTGGGTVIGGNAGSNIGASNVWDEDKFPTTPTQNTSSFSGQNFVSVQPSTAVQTVPAGETAVVNPSAPQTAVQATVTPSYTPVTSPTTTQATTTTPGTTYTAGQTVPYSQDANTIQKSTATQTLSAIPDSTTYKTAYTGTSGAVPTDLVTTIPGSQQAMGTGYRKVKYYNRFYPAQTILITELNGIPTTAVPINFVKAPEAGQQQQQAQTSAARGGLMRMAQGGAVSENSPDVLLARRFLGFNGPSSQLQNFLSANPAAAARMGKYQQAMSSMSSRGFDEGGTTAIGSTGTGSTLYPEETLTGPTLQDFQGMQQGLVSSTMAPMQSPVDVIAPTASDFIPVDAGQTVATAPVAQAATVGTTSQAVTPVLPTVADGTVAKTATGVGNELDELSAQTGSLTDDSKAILSDGEVAQQTTSSVSDIDEAQGKSIDVVAPDKLEVKNNELIDVNNDITGQAVKAATFAEMVQHAEATPTKEATVQGQLEGLMQQFEGGNTPPWAAGAMRAAMASMAQRGLGASSMAGQAMIQAAMESALPIAQSDAATVAQFEFKNLSNRQERAMLAAQQRAAFIGQEFDQAFQARVFNATRFADVANMNFTAEQQIALENSRAANTMELANVSNSQAMVMAEAAALANLDMANLNNRQQAAVQNAQSFLQMDFANLNNQQQTAMFKAQQNIQSLFTDAAAENAMEQFNASSENQSNQFFANLSQQSSQFNASQQNAMEQFNINSTNAMRKFNSEIQQQRDLFNAQNGLVIAQANAQWRQNIATMNTAAQNESNMNYAKTINALTSTNLDQIWQRERDLMSYVYTSDQAALDRALQLVLSDKNAQIVREKLTIEKDTADTALGLRFLFGTSSIIESASDIVDDLTN